MKHAKGRKWLPLLLLIGCPVFLIAGLLFYLIGGNWAMGILLAIFSLLSLSLALALAPGMKPPVRLGGRIGAGVFTGLLGVLALGALFLVAMLNTSLLPAMKTKYVLRFYQTSNPWLVSAFTPESNIQRIFKENGVEAPDDSTDIGSISITTTTAPTTTESAPSTTATTTTTTTQATTTTTRSPEAAKPEDYPATVIFEENGVRVSEIKNANFTARLAEISDPKRVSLGVTNRYGQFGEKLLNMCQRTDSLLGINAGGFYDPKGSGNGGIPSYLLIRDYEVVYTDGQERHNVIGLNDEGVLILGNFTNQEIKDHKIKEGTCFKPYLIVNGKKSTFYGEAGGRDPRSAIGQRPDGTILLLTADGRQSGMEGANQREMGNIMEAYGAYNAAALDGGSSTTMVLNGQIINKPCSLYGPRYLNTAWLVSKQ